MKVLIFLKPEVRFAISRACDSEYAGSPEVRELVMDALATRGYDAERIRKEYAEYAGQCARDGVENRFPGGRV